MRARKNLIASYLFIIVNIIINLLVVRFTVRHYGEGLYAAVVLAYSFVTYVETLNIGVYISNRTQIPLRHKEAGSAFTISSFKFLTKLSFLLIIITSVVFYFLGDKLMGLITSETDPNVLQTGKDLIFIAIIYGLLKIPLSLVLSAFGGQDLVDVEKKYNGIQQIGKFIALWLAIKLNQSVLWYFGLFAILSIGSLIIANIQYYRQFMANAGARAYRYAKRIGSRSVTMRSFKFFIFSLASVVVWSTDNLVVSIFFDPAMVAKYQINFSIFNAAFLFVTAISGAAIASFGNLIRDRHFSELNEKVNFSLYSSLHLALGILVGAVLFSYDVINLWVGGEHFAGYPLIIAFSVFGITVGLSSVLNTLLSLFARSKVIIAMAVGESLLNVFFSILLLHFVGVVGVAVGTSVASVVAVLIPGFYVLKKHFGENIKFELPQLLSQIVLSGIVVWAALQMVQSPLLMRVAFFVIYAVCVLGYTYMKKRSYFNALVRMS